MIDSTSLIAEKKIELEELREKFLWLLSAISEEDWERKIPGESWTAKREMVHIVQALEVVPKGIKQAVNGGSPSLLSFVPSRIRGWINLFMVIPVLSRGKTKASIADSYGKALDRFIALLEGLSEEDWEKGAAYPRKYRTVAQMAHRPKEHFDEHAAHLCGMLGIACETNI